MTYSLGVSLLLAVIGVVLWIEGGPHPRTWAAWLLLAGYSARQLPRLAPAMIPPRWSPRSGRTSRAARCRRIPARGPGAAGKWRCASGASASSTSSTSAGRRVNQDNDRLRAERDELLAAFRHVADVIEQLQ